MKSTGNDKKWWQRYVDNLYTKEDFRQLNHHLNDPQSAGALHELMADIWKDAAVSSPVNHSHHEQYKQEARQLLQRLRPVRRFPRKRLVSALVSVAAACCLLLGIVYFWQTEWPAEINYLEASTSYGERKEICLPDGTSVVLNACSSVRYPDRFVGDERRVTLEGEGYFRVHHDESQPFLVVTPALSVRVLGTCFDVKSYASDRMISVDVEEGQVQVDLPEAMMRLKANERVLINTLSGEYTKQKEQTEVAVWRKGSLRFYRTPLFDVARELERRYHCRIVFADGIGSDNLISGEHENMTLEAVLRSIEYASGIHYRAEGDSIVLYK